MSQLDPFLNANTHMAWALGQVLEMDKKFEETLGGPEVIRIALRQEFEKRCDKVKALVRGKKSELTHLDLRAFDISDTGLMDYPVLWSLAALPSLRSLILAPLIWYSPEEPFAWGFFKRLLKWSRMSLHEITLILPEDVDDQGRIRMCAEFVNRLSGVAEDVGFQLVPKVTIWVEFPGGGQAKLSGEIFPGHSPSFSEAIPLFPAPLPIPSIPAVEGSKRKDGGVRALRVEIPEEEGEGEGVGKNLDVCVGRTYESRRLYDTLSDYQKAPRVGDRQAAAYYVEQAIQSAEDGDEVGVLDLVNFETNDNGFVRWPMLGQLARCRSVRIVLLPHFDPPSRHTPQLSYASLLELLRSFKKLQHVVVYFDTLTEAEVAREVLGPLLETRPHPTMPLIEISGVSLSFRKYE